MVRALYLRAGFISLLTLSVGAWARTPLPGEWQIHTQLNMPNLPPQAAALMNQPMDVCIHPHQTFAAPSPLSAQAHCTTSRAINTTTGLQVNLTCTVNGVRQYTQARYAVSPNRKSYRLTETSTMSGNAGASIPGGAVHITGYGHWISATCVAGSP